MITWEKSVSGKENPCTGGAGSASGVFMEPGGQGAAVERGEEMDGEDGEEVAVVSSCSAVGLRGFGGHLQNSVMI